jgi:hypothetical protein
VPVFICESCSCIENTAVSNYWSRGNGPALCSECDPEIGKWHGRFLKIPYSDKMMTNVLNPPAKRERQKGNKRSTPL